MSTQIPDTGSVSSDVSGANQCLSSVLAPCRSATEDSAPDDMADLHAQFKAQKAAYQQAPYPDIKRRLERICRIKPLLLDNLDAWTEALKKDYTARASHETRIAEVMVTLETLKYSKRKLRTWMAPERRQAGLLNWPGHAWIEYQPLGVVGIMVPWNYPIQLALIPLITALAAGNRVMIKMSEETPHTACLMKRLIAEHFSPLDVAVVNGDVRIAQAFVNVPFDHLLFTGSNATGRRVMQAAAAHLTPVTLELGGKSPCIIGQDFPMKAACERMAFGKWLNAGQTCAAPDYLLCPEHRVEAFIDAWKTQTLGAYASLADNPDVNAIINRHHYHRLQAYLEDARLKGARIIEINPANEDLASCHKIPPTLILNVNDDMQVTQQEIFGPLLVVVPYRHLDDAIAYINARPRPLALYYFDWNRENADYVLKHTHSGGVCLNDTLSHVNVQDLPFGGIGPSGMGAYHGPEGFKTLSHAKSVYRKGRLNMTRLILPPYNRFLYRLFSRYLLGQPLLKALMSGIFRKFFRK